MASENVTFEILQNSNNEYYIAYNDELIPCDDVYCTLLVSNITHANNTGNFTFELSTEEINRIAQRVALEIPQTEQQELNTSVFESQLGSTREDITDNLRSFIMSTVVPEVEKFDELQNKLTEAEITIVDLKAKEINFDLLKENTDKTIDTLERENDRMQFISFLLGIGIIFLTLTCTNPGKEILSYAANLRRNK
jgi:hypothetical protein